MLRPRSGQHQWVAREEYVLSPSVPAVEFTDLFGNLCQRVVAPEGQFSIHTQVSIETADAYDLAPGEPFVEVQNLPENALPFLYASRYCDVDRFTQLAGDLGSSRAPGYDQCVAIVDYIRNHVNFTPGLGQNNLSASEVHEQGFGVCRDLAHLGIACCRALSIPARMVVGYLEALQPMDLHAWFEAYVGNRWYTFDPTQLTGRGGRICIGYGRDAADVAIYTQFGEPVTLLKMDVAVHRMQEPPH